MPERSQVTLLDALPVTPYPHTIDAGRDPGIETGGERLAYIGGIFSEKCPELLAGQLHRDAERGQLHPLPFVPGTVSPSNYIKGFRRRETRKFHIIAQNVYFV